MVQTTTIDLVCIHGPFNRGISVTSTNHYRSAWLAAPGSAETKQECQAAPRVASAAEAPQRLPPPPTPLSHPLHKRFWGRTNNLCQHPLLMDGVHYHRPGHRHLSILLAGILHLQIGQSCHGCGSRITCLSHTSRTQGDHCQLNHGLGSGMKPALVSPPQFRNGSQCLAGQ